MSMPIPPIIREKVNHFERGKQTFRSKAYNETSVREEFINPFFHALGWDVLNAGNADHVAKEVLLEYSLRSAQTTRSDDDLPAAQRADRRPDYAFRIGGDVKFFVEAKQPSRNLETDRDHAAQVRSYGWSRSLPISVLTDFEELAIYDCRVQPFADDPPSTARVLYLKYDQYIDHWDEIADLLSREAVFGGSLDKFVSEKGVKRGTITVDAAFLKEISEWREWLARDIASRNPQLPQRDLNYAVQMIIDRIIFLRIAEDRGTEPYRRLADAASGADAYRHICDLFRAADNRYNSGLFHFRTEVGRDTHDGFTLGLAITDDPLKAIVDRLYYPKSPYRFSVIPIEILGRVYEQFLGKVIRLSPDRTVEVEEKPEVRKAGGVYYTPTYIVDYIVKNTVGKLLDGKTPDQAASLRILDPACGSGSFLIGAYQYLLDWHLNWYVGDAKRGKKKLEAYTKGKDARLRIVAPKDYRLTLEERKRILLNNIYGVDIDTQAVEVTKLSLLLKVLELEEEATAQLGFVRILPDLDSNIKCGNSLIASDFYQRQASFIDPDEAYRINAFDWEDAFPAIMKAGGFDAVIGNPPYIRSQSLGIEQRDYYDRKYRAATGTYDIYALFIEQAITITNDQARVGLILPNKFFTTDYGEGIRRILGRERLIERLVDFEDAQVFSNAGTYTTLLFLSRTSTLQPEYARLGEIFRNAGSTGLANALASGNLSFAPISLTEDGSRWTLATGGSGAVLLRLQQAYSSFSALGPHIFQGLKTSADKVYILKIQKNDGLLFEGTNGLGEQVTLEQDVLMPMVKGEHVQRYSINMSAGLFVLYPYIIDPSGRAKLREEGELASRFPRAWEYLNRYRSILGARDMGKWQDRADWYAYARGQNIGTFLGHKYMVPYMTTRLRAALDSIGEIFFVNITTGGYGLRVEIGLHNEAYILALLNSTLMNYCICQMTNRFRGGYFAINKQALERLPIRTIDFASPADKTRHDQMVQLVTTMLDLHRQLAAANTPHDKTFIERRIRDTDRQIDRLVYDLYGLTDEEITIVEGGKS